MTDNIILKKNNFDKSTLLSSLSKDIPGVLECMDKGFFGENKVKIRAMFLFEETLRLLHEDTINKLGVKIAENILYKSGKDVASKYFSKHKKAKKVGRKLLEKIFVKELSNNSSFFIGMHFFDKIDIEFKKGIYIFHFKDGIINKKYLFSYFSGMLSGFLSYLLNKNIESKYLPKKNKLRGGIIARESFSEKYSSSNHKEKSINEHTHFNNKFNLYTFSDFLKFKKIYITKQNFMYKKSPLLFVEFGTLEVIYKNYISAGIANLFEKSIINSSKKICINILKKYKINKKKSVLIKNLFSAMGICELNFSRVDNIIIVSIAKNKYISVKSCYIQFFINGFLNSIHKNVKIISIKNLEFRYEILSIK